VNTLLVIGGSGFFGKSILSAYKRGLLTHWGVSCVKILSRSASRLSASNPELVGPTVELLDFDIGICDKLPNAQYVIHAASSTDLSKYLSQPLEEQKNIQASVLNYCRLAPIYHANSKIVYASSGAIYGPQSISEPFLHESSSLGNIEEMVEGKRHYAAAKRDAEGAIKRLGLVGQSVAIARCFAFLGPYLPRDQHFAIGNFIQDGLIGRPIKVNTDKSVYRSYMYADDLVDWLMTIAASANPQCPIFNVGSNEAIEIRDLATQIGGYFGVKVEAPLLTDKPVDLYIPSVKKAFSTLDLTCKYDLSSAILETIKKIQSA